MPSIEGNIKKLYILRALEFAWVSIPTIVLFFQSKGLTLEGIMIVKAIMCLVVVVGEIPSGYFADVCGRKHSLVCGGVLWLCSTLTFATGDTFMAFAFAELLLGLAVSLLSGANSAVAYDTLLQLERDDEYIQMESRYTAISGFSEAICGLIGAGVAVASLVYPFYLQAALNLAYVLLALSLAEPERTKLADTSSKVRQIGEVIWTALVKQASLRWIILYCSISATATWAIVWLAQAFMEKIEIPVFWFGVIWAILHVVLALASLLTPMLESRLGLLRSLFWIAILLSAGFIGLSFSHTVWGLLFIALIYAIRGIRTPLVKNYINAQTTSDVRATVLSVNSFLFRLTFVIIGPVIGYCMNAYSLSTGICVMGLFILILKLPLLIAFKTSESKQKIKAFTPVS